MIDYPDPPPDIRHFKGYGLTGVLITCTNCNRMTVMGWETLALPEDRPFPDIDRLKRFASSSCGSKAVTITPDWAACEQNGGR